MGYYSDFLYWAKAILLFFPPALPCLPAAASVEEGLLDRNEV
jgi:hypothetical protein